MFRKILFSAAIVALMSGGAARAEDVLVTTTEPGGGEIAIVVKQIAAVQPHDAQTCVVWIGGGRRVIIDMPYAQVLNLLASETPAQAKR